MANGEYDFSGVWHSAYTYTSSAREGDFVSEYDVKIIKKGNQLVIESYPNAEKSYVIMRLSLDGRVVTGAWQEHTSPIGFYKGVVYHGALQLVIDEDGRAMRGKWVGFDRTLHVRSGDWSLTRLKDEDAAEHAKLHAAVD